MSEWLLWENSRIGPSNTPTPGECCIRLSCCTSALCGFIYLWLSQISFLGARSDCRSSGSVAVINASSLIVCCKLNWAGTSCHCSATSCCIVCVLLAGHCLLAVCMSICLCEMHPPPLPLIVGGGSFVRGVGGLSDQGEGHTEGGLRGLKGAIIQRTQWVLCDGGCSDAVGRGRGSCTPPLSMFLDRRRRRGSFKCFRWSMAAGELIPDGFGFPEMYLFSFLRSSPCFFNLHPVLSLIWGA